MADDAPSPRFTEDRLTAIILAAGKGTRMKGNVPKVLHEVLGKPLVVHVAEAALAAGCDDVVIVTGHGAEAVEAAVAQSLPDAPLRFARQEVQLGTGHAVLAAAPLLQRTHSFFVLSGDVPGTAPQMLRELAAAARASAAPVAVVTCKVADATGYGRVVRSQTRDGRILRVVEHRDATPQELHIAEINTGIYWMQRDLALDILRRSGTQNAQGEVYLTDVISQSVAGDLPVVAHPVPDGPEIWGINDRVDLARVQEALGERLKARWMREGVTMDAPSTIHIDASVVLSPDVQLGRGVRLSGDTHIAAGARIDDGSIVRNSTVATGAHVKAYCVIDTSSVGPGAEVGPFAHLRPATKLEAHAKVGNFVETKKATLGEGSKASHLSYLGDCTIGRYANIGAGTITCNYDGTHKHPSHIGDRAFIGSDTQLVAPVSVGEGAFVGAGSTITEDVPPGALAISRQPQRNIEGWAERRRQRQE